MSKITKIDEWKREKETEAWEKEHAEGRAFCFERVSDPEELLGIGDPRDDYSVFMLLDPESLSGLAFTPDGARRLATALNHIADQLEIEGEVTKVT